MARRLPKALALVLLLCAAGVSRPAPADTLYRCKDPNGEEWIGNEAGRRMSWVTLRHCRPVDLAPRVAPKTARCRVTTLRNTIFRCCDIGGVNWCTGGPASRSQPAEVAAAAPSPRTERAAPRSSVEPIEAPDPALAPKGRTDLDAVIAKAATDHGIPEPLLRAVITVESGYRADAVSPAGAQGLMQLMPVTQEYLSVEDPFDPEQNVRAGAKLLRLLSDRFHGDVERTVAAYYSGPTAVRRAGGIPSEASATYVRKVLDRYRALAK